jgi:hypothetical protein
MLSSAKVEKHLTRKIRHLFAIRQVSPFCRGKTQRKTSGIEKAGPLLLGEVPLHGMRELCQRARFITAHAGRTGQRIAPKFRRKGRQLLCGLVFFSQK